MRQAGMLAAAGIWALKNLTSRMKDDLEMAKLLAKELTTKFKGKIDVVNENPEMNMVFFKIPNEKVEKSAFSKFLLERGIKVVEPGKDSGGKWRFATHYYINEKEVTKIIGTLEEFFKSLAL